MCFMALMVSSTLYGEKRCEKGSQKIESNQDYRKHCWDGSCTTKGKKDKSCEDYAKKYEAPNPAVPRVYECKQGPGTTYFPSSTADASKEQKVVDDYKNKGYTCEPLDCHDPNVFHKDQFINHMCSTVPGVGNGPNLGPGGHH